MFKPKEKPIIISIGGSLIIPNGGINTDFLSKLNTFIRRHVKKGRRFILVTGGGATARHYIDGGKQIIGDITDEDLDWLGIHSTRLNGHLLRTIFMDIAHPRIIENYDKKLKNWREPVAIGTGWKPGWSTDYDAVIMARDHKSNYVINLTDISWVYDKDPDKFKNAKPIKRLTWEEMESLIGRRWEPGSSTPFDPIAAQLAKKLGLSVVITSGYDFDNLDRIIEGDVFKGTIIMPFKIDASFYDREYYLGKKGGVRFSYIESFWGRAFHNLANLYRAFVIKISLNPQKTLDVGCGTGYLVKWLRFFGVDAYGVEISKYALDAAPEDIKPYLKKGDILRLPYKNNEFDLVFTFDVLEHLERSKIKKAVDETARVSNKYVLHKMYTSENLWMTYVHGKDFSHLSVMPENFWRSIFSEIGNLHYSRKYFFKLPSFFETIFLLKKAA